MVASVWNKPAANSNSTTVQYSNSIGTIPQISLWLTQKNESLPNTNLLWINSESQLYVCVRARVCACVWGCVGVAPSCCFSKPYVIFSVLSVFRNKKQPVSVWSLKEPPVHPHLHSSVLTLYNPLSLIHLLLLSFCSASCFWRPLSFPSFYLCFFSSPAFQHQLINSVANGNDQPINNSSLNHIYVNVVLNVKGQGGPTKVSINS